MSEILRFEKGAAKRFTRRLSEQMSAWGKSAADNAISFLQLVNDNPGQAVDRIPEFILRARDSAGPGSHVWEAYAGGACELWTAPVLDIVGTIYPILPKDIRKRALEHSLDFLDRQNYFVAQDNVERINEPWLVGDIVLNRWIYWCGFEEYSDLLEKHQNWGEVYRKLDKIKSAFWFSMAVALKEHASDEVRENYYRFFPTLIDRTKDAIAAIAVVHAQTRFLKTGASLEESVEDELVGFDPTLLPDIKRRITEQKWVDLDEPVHINPSDGSTRWKHRSEIEVTYCPNKIVEIRVRRDLNLLNHPVQD